jgi:hypothetical protein
MAVHDYRRVFIEVVTTEVLNAQDSIDNMLFQLSEGLRKHTIIVQLHVIERAETLAQISTGIDMIPDDSRLETRNAHGVANVSHAECLSQACAVMGAR